MRRTQGHSTAGRIVSMKICTDTLGNLSRDFPACSAVPHPTAALRETEGHLINGVVRSCTHITA